MPEKPHNFWQELKRRNVVRVITVYAGAAFVIIELINNITEPLKLPEWTPTLIIVLLAIGFPVIIIFSWIYDVHPERGMVKTEPASKVKAEEIPKSSNGWKIASYISFVVILGLAALNIFGGKGGARIDESLSKSIAVLPFHNLSGDDSQDYICIGLTDEIISDLFRVASFDAVRSLTSVMPYHESEQNIGEIAEALQVNYILEGSYKRMGNEMKITAQLIEPGNDKHIWLHDYELPYSEVPGIPGEIALQIADHLQAFISEEEMSSIDRIPTKNIEAYDLTMQAQKFYYDYILSADKNDVELIKIRHLCEAALELDPGYAQAYFWLGNSFLSDQYVQGYARPFYLDTALYFLNKAIELDTTFAAAYAHRGMYYQEKAQRQMAIDDYNKAISLSPNNAIAYLFIGVMYTNSRDYEHALINLTKAERLTKSGITRSLIYTSILYIYLSAGDIQKAELYCQELEKYNMQAAGMLECFVLGLQGKVEEVLTKAERFIALYPEIADGYETKAIALLGLGRIQEAEDYIRKSLEYSGPDLSNAYWVGIVLWMNGKRDEAMKYFDMQINNCIESINSKDQYGQTSAPYDLARVYAFLGNKEEAYRWLREFEKLGFIGGTHESIKTDPLFDNLRNDDEFKEIVKRANDEATEIRIMINQLEEQGKL